MNDSTNDSKAIEHKRCTDCGGLLPLSEFWARKRSHDGRAPYCKACFSLRNAAAYDRRLAREGGNRSRVYRRVSDAPEGMRWCPSCATFLSLEEFVRNRSATDGIGSYCRPCQNAKAKESRQRVHGGSRHYHLKRRYGLGAEEVQAMLLEQGELCPICERSLSVKDAHVDHDHATGAVRAVLCFNCNGGLGQFRDDPTSLVRAVAYLMGDSWRQTDLSVEPYLRLS
jgi:Recombination endonuclease VII